MRTGPGRPQWHIPQQQALPKNARPDPVGGIRTGTKEGAPTVSPWGDWQGGAFRLFGVERGRPGRYTARHGPLADSPAPSGPYRLPSLPPWPRDGHEAAYGPLTGSREWHAGAGAPLDPATVPRPGFRSTRLPDRTARLTARRLTRHRHRHRASGSGIRVGHNEDRAPRRRCPMSTVPGGSAGRRWRPSGTTARVRRRKSRARRVRVGLTAPVLPAGDPPAERHPGWSGGSPPPDRAVPLPPHRVPVVRHRPAAQLGPVPVARPFLPASAVRSGTSGFSAARPARSRARRHPCRSGAGDRYGNPAP